MFIYSYAFARCIEPRRTAGNYPRELCAGSRALGAGELCIGPALISAITNFSPNRLRGTLMGTWFFVVGFAGYLGSIVVKNGETHHHTVFNPVSNIYMDSFLEIAAITLAVCIFMVIASPVIRRIRID